MAEIVLSITTVAAVATALFALWTTLLALRAKRRAMYALYEEASADAELRHLIELAREHRLTLADCRQAPAVIEKRLYKLPERDRAFIEEGLHQPNALGAKRYLTEVLAGT